MGLRGFLWVRLWEVKILWVWIMGVTLVVREDTALCTIEKILSFKFLDLGIQTSHRIWLS